jgi:hypothetical protein
VTERIFVHMFENVYLSCDVCLLAHAAHLRIIIPFIKLCAYM